MIYKVRLFSTAIFNQNPPASYFQQFTHSPVAKWDFWTPKSFGETILLHFLIGMMVLIKNQEGVDV